MNQADLARVRTEIDVMEKEKSALLSLRTHEGWRVYLIRLTQESEETLQQMGQQSDPMLAMKLLGAWQAMNTRMNWLEDRVKALDINIDSHKSVFAEQYRRDV